MRTFQCLLAAIFIGLTVMATPLSAVTVDICKTQWCETYAAENRTACSELGGQSQRVARMGAR